MARILNPGEHVPRIPNGSHVPVCSSSSWSRCVRTATWSPPSASSSATHGRQQIVGLVPVADRRRLLLERTRSVFAHCDAGDRAAHVAPGPDLRRRGGDQSLLRDEVAQVLLEPVAAVEVPDDAGDLDLMHREDHRARPAALAEDETGSGNLVHSHTAAAELRRDERRQRLGLAQRVDRLVREASFAIDLVDPLGGDVVGDPLATEEDLDDFDALMPRSPRRATR